MLDLDELERVARAATPGPWKQMTGLRFGRVWHPETDPQRRRHTQFLGECFENFEGQPEAPSHTDPTTNAAFIAAANPQTILALLERLREAEAVLDELETAEPWTDPDIDVSYLHTSNVDIPIRAYRVKYPRHHQAKEMDE